MSAKRGAAPERRSSQALDAYEKAIRALGKKEYQRARDLLGELIASHPEERDLLERARSYRAICERGLEKRPRPKTFEDYLNFGVYLLNRGEYPEALKALQHAADIHPKNEHVLYCLAAAQARTGDTAAAIKALRSAIHANPANRSQARRDADFDPIRGDSDFVALVQA
jgi:tetratricopeptide (TPR) repeat protein